MQSSELFKEKLVRIHRSLVECYEDSRNYSSSISGTEREIVNRELFEKILPSSYRVGAGTIVDSYGRETGQIDAVIELPFSVSFPVSSDQNRLYLADSVGAAFEIKSDLYRQWDEAVNKIRELKRLARIRAGKNEIVLGGDYFIPSFIIGFAGYASTDAIWNKMKEIQPRDRPDGVLIINRGIFVGNIPDWKHEGTGESQSILAFIACIYTILNQYANKFVALDEYAKLLK